MTEKKIYFFFIYYHYKPHKGNKRNESENEKIKTNMLFNTLECVLLTLGKNVSIII